MSETQQEKKEKPDLNLSEEDQYIVEYCKSPKLIIDVQRRLGIRYVTAWSKCQYLVALGLLNQTKNTSAKNVYRTIESEEQKKK